MITVALVLALAQAPQDGVSAALEAGRHHEAMAAARALQEPAKAAAEAEVLYQARSYDEALDRVRAALAAGAEPSGLLLSRGISAAIWVGDASTGRDLLARLGAAVETLPEPERPGWRDHARDLAGFLDGLEARQAGTDAARDRARTASVALGLVALGLLALGLRPHRRPRP